MNEDNEWSDGTIQKECPNCGQFCKIPKMYWASYDKGAYAHSYCKRCKKRIKLSVEFI